MSYFKAKIVKNRFLPSPSPSPQETGLESDSTPSPGLESYNSGPWSLDCSTIVSSKLWTQY